LVRVPCREKIRRPFCLFAPFLLLLDTTTPGSCVVVGTMILRSSCLSSLLLLLLSSESVFGWNQLNPKGNHQVDRRAFFAKTALVLGGVATTMTTTTTTTAPAHAIGGVGPVKLSLLHPIYSAKPCPPEKPIPGMKAMKGMRGLCVTVDADLSESPPKDLSKVGVYGIVTDTLTNDSVLANNPDLNTDSGQFAMIESVKETDKKVQFEFIAAVPKDKKLEEYDNGIGPLTFESLKIISFPGGEQYGAISPCEMNEFSDECEEWEEENGPYVRGQYMMQSNPRTKGR